MFCNLKILFNIIFHLLNEFNLSRKSLKETKSRQEVQIADLKSNLNSLEEEKRAIQSECSRIKKEAGAMEKKLTDREVQLSEVVTRMNMTDKEITVKDELLMKERDQLHLERESKVIKK